MAETLSVTDMLPNKFEPKRSYRWVLAIEGIDAFMIASTNRPQVNIGEKKIDFFNSYGLIAGKLEFQNLSGKLRDPIAPSGARQVKEWISTHYESV